MIVPLILAIGLSGVFAQWRTLAELSWVSAFVAGSALLAIALRPVGEQENPQSGRPLAAIGAPILVALWVGRVAHLTPGAHWQFPLAVTTAFAVLVLLVGYRARARSAGWFNEATDIFAVGFAFVLAAAAAFDIERETSAVLLESICVAALVLIASWNGERVRVGHWIIPATVIGVALVLQANLLRWLGPPGELNALDVAKMNWPTLVSLLWASIGAALTIWARRVGSRVQWSAGAAFLVGAAIKLLLLDFGSLGQLANILAVIAAGGVFLLVGWLAPMPPAQEKPPAAATPAPPHEPMEGSAWGARTEIVAPERDSGSKLVWTVAIAAIVLLSFSQCRSRHERDFGIDLTSVDYESMTRRVLFVCLGNICRSPTAEGVLRAIAAREFPGLKIEVDSAGTADYHVGEPPDRRTVAAARRRGYDLAGLRARQVQPADFDRFDFVLAMDRANLAELESRRPQRATAQAGLVPGVRAGSRCRGGARSLLRRHRGLRARARSVRSGGARFAGAVSQMKKARTLARAGPLDMPD